MPYTINRPAADRIDCYFNEDVIGSVWKYDDGKFYADNGNGVATEVRDLEHGQNVLERFHFVRSYATLQEAVEDE
jgi:hypothetical protein